MKCAQRDPDACTCPDGWPSVTQHSEPDGPIAVVAHHSMGCRMPSVRIYGAGSSSEFERRIAQAIGSREGGEGAIGAYDG